MRTSLVLAPIVFALTAISWAQVSSESANSQDQVAASPALNSTAATDMLPPGTVLLVELSNWLDAKKCKANDKIEARTVADVSFPGRTVVRRNTKIVGHITEAKAHSKTSPGSRVGIAFDRLLLKGGPEVPLQMTIQAIARPAPEPAYLSGPDDLADKPRALDRPPQVGAQAPVTGSSSVTPKYPDIVPAPPSTNVIGPSPPAVDPLGPTSRGVVGIKGLSLDTSGPVSVLSSSSGNLHLEGSTRLVLRVR